MNFVTQKKTNVIALFESFLNIYFSSIDSLPCSVAEEENKGNRAGALRMQWYDGKLTIALKITK